MSWLGNTELKGISCVNPACNKTPFLCRIREGSCFSKPGGNIRAYRVACHCGWRGPQRRKKGEAIAEWLLVQVDSA